MARGEVLSEALSLGRGRGKLLKNVDKEEEKIKSISLKVNIKRFS